MKIRRAGKLVTRPGSRRNTIGTTDFDKYGPFGIRLLSLYVGFGVGVGVASAMAGGLWGHSGFAFGLAALCVAGVAVMALRYVASRALSPIASPGDGWRTTAPPGFGAAHEIVVQSSPGIPGQIRSRAPARSFVIA
ncbi:hypothetical protein [Glaciibacter superstes]|uniref:hypothetical protein n=1 Tax=Glaciibacter superstes TaxID=501023 RepID=UPI000479C264|nr:hypothetical protein [Glaciibacter superstes]